MCLKVIRVLSGLRSLVIVLALFTSAAAWASGSRPSTPRFRVVVLAEKGGIHLPFVEAAKTWLNHLAAKDNFAVDYIEDTAPINDAFLSRYKVFIQLNYPPYNWTPTAQAAFIRYIEKGKGGWIGFHHATLLGEFDGFQMWPWFSQFMGGIRFTAYIPTFADGTVTVEYPSHPVMSGVPSSFVIEKEEWYTWGKSPRPNVRVLASVDESTYKPSSKIRMGDHPVIWTNPHYKARNIYIFMGHHPELFQNPAFTRIFTTSIFWTAHEKEPHHTSAT
ncbi:MAG TPA: ThuA domain-containing protein [Alloacidobacterium sp.]|nr:ThuA domain-containing protein [Alloacidobacterium sp.]